MLKNKMQNNGVSQSLLERITIASHTTIGNASSLRYSHIVPVLCVYERDRAKPKGIIKSFKSPIRPKSLRWVKE